MGHDPRNAIAAFERAIPKDWQLVNSSGHSSYFAAQMHSRPFEKFLTIREFGAIGNGISFAIGVAAALPDDTIVLFDGDGSLLMHIQELETIRRHRLKILIIVLNDSAYGSEIHKLRANGLSVDGAVFEPTDFANLARGFGLSGAKIKDLNQIPTLLSEFSNSDRGAVFDLEISDKILSPVMERAISKYPN